MPADSDSRTYVVNGVVLSLTTPPEQFLQAVIWNYETAARFVLDSALADPAPVAEYLARFLAKLHRELNTDIVLTDDHYLRPRPGVETTFGNNRPSISHIALRRFCELLFENPNLVALIQAHKTYANELGVQDFFAYRASSHFALTRGLGWTPAKYAFKDPVPIPLSVKFAYQERMRQQASADERARVREAELVAARRIAKKEERRLATVPRLLEERRRSAENKAFREQIGSLPLADQARQLALDETHSIRVFPTDPDQINDFVLMQLDRDTREHLLERVSGRWEPFWKRLADRIRLVQREHTT